jgi:CyaY protein
MASHIDEATYQQLVDRAFRRIEDALEAVDPADVDVDGRGDVLTLTLRDGVRCVVNTQRPTRQIWLAARARAWHFDYEPDRDLWVDDKSGEELYAVLARILFEGCGISVTFFSH